MARNRVEEFHQLVDGDSTVPFLTSAWQHFTGHENDTEDFAQHTIDFVRKWDWDWVKINPRATYYSEVWGAQFSPTDYGDIPIQKQLRPAIASPGDIVKVIPINPRDSTVLQEHINGARMIKEAFPDRVVIQTVFSPLSILLQMSGLPLYLANGVYGAETTFSRDDLIFRQPQAAHAALQAIADTFTAYAKILIAPVGEGGADLDGIFFAVTGTASDGYFSKEQLEEYSAPFDKQIMGAVKDAGKVVVFHTCRDHSHPEWFKDYPMTALHWDQFLPGNPPISHGLGITPVGGVNYPLFAPGEDLDEAKKQLDETIEECVGRPFLLAPSCTVPTPASDKALSLLRNA